MKATIRDAEVLKSVRPTDMAAYLRTHGWLQTAAHDRFAAEWTSPQEQGSVLLPLDRNLADFAARMSDLLYSLEAVEGRSQLEILQDVSLSGFDVVRLRAALPTATDGTIPVNLGSDLVEGAREMLLAAASVTAEHRTFFPTRKPAAAVAYMENVRLGQTERGSYIVTLLSPVAPELRREGQQALDLDEPFERRVTTTLARSTSALRLAASDAVATGRFESFEVALENGVTANLCTAVASLTEGLGATGDLEIGVSWSPIRPPNAAVPQVVHFGADTAPTIREAARIIREAAPIDDYAMVGVIIRLEQRPGEQTGRVWIFGLAGEAPRSVAVTLPAAEYALAIEAHRERIPVEIVGRLTRSGPYFQVESPHGFRLLRDV